MNLLGTNSSTTLYSFDSIQFERGKVPVMIRESNSFVWMTQDEAVQYNRSYLDKIIRQKMARNLVESAQIRASYSQKEFMIKWIEDHLENKK